MAQVNANTWLKILGMAMRKQLPAAEKKAPTKRQKDCLKEFGFRLETIKTTADATRIIGIESARRINGLATPRQLVCLMLYGHEDMKRLPEMTKTEATKLIAKCKTEEPKCNKLRLFQVVAYDGKLKTSQELFSKESDAEYMIAKKLDPNIDAMVVEAKSKLFYVVNTKPARYFANPVKAREVANTCGVNAYTYANI